MREQIIQHIISALKLRKNFFLNEEDIQLYLANYFIQSNEFENVFVEYRISDELLKNYPWKNKEIYIDIVLKFDGNFFPIEIKYKTTNQIIQISVVGTTEHYFTLKHHGAKDIGCYDFWKDVKRIEILEESFEHCQLGIVLFVSNDPTYQIEPKNSSVSYYQFSIHNGRKLMAGETLKWNNDPVVVKVRHPITMKREYKIIWSKMSLDQHHFILI
jgi:hypothetical protein